MIDEKLIHSKVDSALYIHDSFTSMFRGMLNWIQDGFDNRFNYKVMATYDKAVQFFNQKRKSKDGNNSTNILPSITLDPNLDFLPEERSGKFNWMYSNLDNIHGRYFAKRIDLREQGVIISIMRTRYSGTCDITFWLSSVYELLDIRTKLLQYCNGTGRWIRPDFFWSHVILPKEIIEFKRPSDGKQLDWSATPVEVIQLASTNSKEYAVSYPLDAIWRLDSLSDGSTKYGADQLTEWKLTATFTWECDIPTFIRLDNYAFPNMKPTIHFGLGPTYSQQPLLNKIDTYRFLSSQDIAKNYLWHEQIYTISENRSPFIKLDDKQCDRFPTFYPEYNHIVSAPLYTYEQLFQLQYDEQFPNHFIFLMDKWEDKFLDFLRKADGCICRYDDASSEFYSVVSSINLPTICSFDEKIYKGLLRHCQSEITMDPVSMQIYSGKVKTHRLDPSHLFDKENYDVANRVLDLINSEGFFKSDKFRNLDLGDMTMVTKDRDDILGKYNPDQYDYKLIYPITGVIKSKFKLYVNDQYVPRTMYDLYNSRIVFHDDVSFNLGAEIRSHIEGYCQIYSVGNAINYHITKEDERAYYTKGKKIELEIPFGFNSDYIKCCSYNGLLDEHTDYEVTEDKKRIVFKLVPMRDKVIQVFMNRK